MQIGELSERTGASRRSIRYYEQQGLLEAARTSKGWRAYDERAVHRVLNVRELLAAGLTVEDIRVVVPCLDTKTEEFLACEGGPDEVVAMYEQRLAAVEAKSAELQRHRAELVERIATLRAGATGAEDFERLLRTGA
ncbi:MerR family transcriptional regulator [Streptomyces sp. NPDC002851]